MIPCAREATGRSGVIEAPRKPITEGLTTIYRGHGSNPGAPVATSQSNSRNPKAGRPVWSLRHRDLAWGEEIPSAPQKTYFRNWGINRGTQRSS